MSVVTPLLGCGARSELDSPHIPIWPSADAGATHGTPPHCENAATDMFILGNDSTLYLLDPTTLGTQRLGPLPCSVRLSSMAVARDHTLWVGGQRGELYHSDWRTCTNTGFNAANFNNDVQGSGIGVDLEGKEYLFAVPQLQHGTGSAVDKIVVVDLETVQVRAKLPLESGIGMMELAGNGDSRLFGIASDFGTGRVVTLMQIDPTDGHFLWRVDASEVCNPFICTYGCDMAFWGGALYIFNSDLNNKTSSEVWRYEIDSAQLTHVGTLPFVVIGADSTTCAPL